MSEEKLLPCPFCGSPDVGPFDPNVDRTRSVADMSRRRKRGIRGATRKGGPFFVLPSRQLARHAWKEFRGRSPSGAVSAHPQLSA